MTAQQHDSPHDKSGVYSSTPIYREGIREQDIPSILSDFDLHLFGQGKEYRIYEKMGAHLLVVNGVTGVNFALWAPNARSVSVIGDFNGWRHGATPMHLRHQDLGVWECFVPGLTAGALYKYAITSRFNDYTVEKGDPYGFAVQLRPKTASIVAGIHQHPWRDEVWMQERAEHQQLSSPISIYEMHVGSWRRVLDQSGEPRILTYRELAHALAPYIKDLGFTHVELLPMTEYPYDGSWGYQVTGYFAPTTRYGSPEDFQYFVDYMHQQGIGVLLDRALFWLREYHIDGLRVDAVASMLYLDYSRKPGESIPNRYGGREHLEAVDFLRQLNEAVYAEQPGTLTIAEESTAWPMVTRPTYMGGLGFSLKWNMGWMHDMLDYMSLDPAYRRYHQNSITFSLMYAYTENFVLPLSHDEVVYGKKSLLSKMTGDLWQKFANLRAFYGYMWGHPGKKLLFMGGEFGQWLEWNYAQSLDWHLLEPPSDPHHAQLRNFLRDLCVIYQHEPALSELDYDPAGFSWIDCYDSDNSVVSFIR